MKIENGVSFFLMFLIAVVLIVMSSNCGAIEQGKLIDVECSYYHVGGSNFRTECNQEFHIDSGEHFDYCPYCGKDIEWE